MDHDALVVGAGPGGCLAAREMARAGRDVLLVDAAFRETLGKSIVVEAERETMRRVGVAQPEGEERPYHQRRSRFFSSRRELFTLDVLPAVALRLDLFSRRLLAQAEGAGARFRGGCRALAPLVEGGRVVGVRLATEGREEEVRAHLVVDATGFEAALARRLAPEVEFPFPEEAGDVVLAENHVHDIDAAAARAAVAAGLQGDDEVWVRLGGQGNYSTEYSYLSLARGVAYLLVGFKASHGEPMEAVLARHRQGRGYYGARRYGGQARIRIRRSLDRLVADGFLAVGEAACQVIPMHGSGVSSALLAGWIAGRVGAAALEAGDTSAAALWPYAHAYQSERGAILAAYDLNRRFVERTPLALAEAFLESGAIQPEDIAEAAIPRLPMPALASLPARLRGLLRVPRAILPAARFALDAGAVLRHYRRYPERHDEEAFRRWQSEAARLFAPWHVS